MFGYLLCLCIYLHNFSLFHYLLLMWKWYGPQMKEIIGWIVTSSWKTVSWMILYSVQMKRSNTIFYLYEKQILKICSETHSLSGIRSKMKILPCLSLFVILTAGKDLKPEEHWRPATGKDLSKYENKRPFPFLHSI